MVASYKFSIYIGVAIIQSMVGDFNVCGLLDFHEGNFSVDCNEKMLTLLQLLWLTGCCKCMYCEEASLLVIVMTVCYLILFSKG